MAAAIANNTNKPDMNSETRNTRKSSGFLRRILCSAFIAAPLLLGGNQASAQNGANADAAYNGFVNAYVVRANVNGHNYPLPYICNSLTDRNYAFMWQQNYMIQGLQDAYDKNYTSASRRQLVIDLINTSMTQDHSDLTWASWNDDIEWASMTRIRGYHQFGVTAWRDSAVQNLNAVWNRGWSNDLGGGLWIRHDIHDSKCVLSNAPWIIAAGMVYRATGDTSFVTRSEQIYAWMRSRCFNANTGQLVEGIGSNNNVLGQNSPTPTWSGTGNYYNNGIFLNAANTLYKITGNVSYYNDALKAANWVVNNNAILTQNHPNNGPFGSEKFFRALSLFAAQNGLWSTYEPWLQANCTASWNRRRTDYNITWNNYGANTPTGNLLSMEMISSVIVQAVTQISPIAGPHFIRNGVTGLSLDNASSTAQGAPITQWGWNGGIQQLWDFRQNSDSTWTIKSLHSGRVLENPASSTANGTQMVQWNSNGGSNQKWVITQQSNGSYRIQNQASGKVLDNNNNSANGTPVVQWSANGGSNQTWNLR